MRVPIHPRTENDRTNTIAKLVQSFFMCGFPSPGEFRLCSFPLQGCDFCHSRGKDLELPVEESMADNIRIARRAFAGAVFAGLGITGLRAKPAKPQSGSTPMRVFGRTGVRLTVIGQG